MSSEDLVSMQTAKILRYLIYGFNAAMGVLAVAFVILTLTEHLGQDAAFFTKLIPQTDFSSTTWFYVIILLLLAAIALVIYGAYMLMLNVLLVYLGLLIAVFIAEGVIGYGIFYGFNDLGEAIVTALKKSLLEYPGDTTIKNDWDRLQSVGKCCGVDNPTEWFQVFAEGSVPSSCCVSYNPGEKSLCRFSTDPDVAYQTGCYTKIKEMAAPLLDRYLVLDIVLQIVQLLNIVFVAVLAYILWKKSSIVHRQPQAHPINMP